MKSIVTGSVFTTKTNYSVKSLEKKKKKFEEKLAQLKNFNPPTENAFEVLIVGFQVLAELSVKYLKDFQDIFVHWTSFLEELRTKCTTEETKKTLYGALPELTKNFMFFVTGLDASVKFRLTAFKLWSFVMFDIPCEIIERVVTQQIGSIKQLMQCIFQSGNYLTQLEALEVFNNYIHNCGELRSKILDQILIGAQLKPLREILENFDVFCSDLENRRFLNILNMEISIQKGVYSIRATDASMGLICIENPIDKKIGKTDLWLDFNCASKTVSFFCSSTTFGLTESIDAIIWVWVEMEVKQIEMKSCQHICIKGQNAVASNKEYDDRICAVKSIEFSTDKSSFEAFLKSDVIKLFNETINRQELVVEEQIQTQANRNAPTNDKQNHKMIENKMEGCFLNTKKPVLNKEDENTRTKEDENPRTNRFNYSRCIPSRQRSASSEYSTNLCENMVSKVNSVASSTHSLRVTEKSVVDSMGPTQKFPLGLPFAEKSNGPKENQLPLKGLKQTQQKNTVNPKPKVVDKENDERNLIMTSGVSKMRLELNQKNSKKLKSEALVPQPCKYQRAKKSNAELRRKQEEICEKLINLVKPLKAADCEGGDVVPIFEDEEQLRTTTEAYAENNGMIGINNILNDERRCPNLSGEQRQAIQENVKTINAVCERTVNRFFKSKNGEKATLSIYDVHNISADDQNERAGQDKKKVPTRTNATVSNKNANVSKNQKNKKKESVPAKGALKKNSNPKPIIESTIDDRTVMPPPPPERRCPQRMKRPSNLKVPSSPSNSDEDSLLAAPVNKVAKKETSQTQNIKEVAKPEASQSNKQKGQILYTNIAQSRGHNTTTLLERRLSTTTITKSVIETVNVQNTIKQQFTPINENLSYEVSNGKSCPQGEKCSNYILDKFLDCLSDEQSIDFDNIENDRHFEKFLMNLDSISQTEKKLPIQHHLRNPSENGNSMGSVKLADRQEVNNENVGSRITSAELHLQLSGSSNSNRKRKADNPNDFGATSNKTRKNTEHKRQQVITYGEMRDDNRIADPENHHSNVALDSILVKYNNQMEQIVNKMLHNISTILPMNTISNQYLELLGSFQSSCEYHSIKADKIYKRIQELTNKLKTEKLKLIELQQGSIQEAQEIDKKLEGLKEHTKDQISNAEARFHNQIQDLSKISKDTMKIIWQQQVESEANEIYHNITRHTDLDF